MAPTNEVSVSPKGFFGFIKLVALAVVDSINRHKKSPRKPGKWKCWCGRRYTLLADRKACDHTGPAER